MASELFSSLMKGLSGFMPQDDPCVQAFHLQNEIAEINEKENKLYMEVGKLVLSDASEGGYSEQMQSLMLLQAEKASAEQKLSDLQRRKEDKKEDKKEEAGQAADACGNTCHLCGNVNPTGMSFCQECGAKLGTPAIHKCSGCGNEVAAGNKFCGICGMKIE